VIAQNVKDTIAIFWRADQGGEKAATIIEWMKLYLGRLGAAGRQTEPDVERRERRKTLREMTNRDTDAQRQRQTERERERETETETEMEMERKRQVQTQRRERERQRETVRARREKATHQEKHRGRQTDSGRWIDR
jgi:hypothetical protein